MASATGNTTIGTAEASSYAYLKEFYQQISPDYLIHLVWEVGSDNDLGLGMDG